MLYETVKKKKKKQELKPKTTKHQIISLINLLGF